MAEAKDFADALTDAAERHVEPDSEEAAELAGSHLASITRFYEAERERQILLARVYIADSRFDRYYHGNAGYLLELIEAQARKEGIDPDAAERRWVEGSSRSSRPFHSGLNPLGVNS